MLSTVMMTELEGVEAAAVSMRAAPDVARARFDDGAVRQAPMSSGVVDTWRVRALVKPGRLDAFRTWADAQGAGWFMFLAPGMGVDPPFQGRFVGGAGRVTYQQTAAGAGAARWTAEMEVEMRPKNVGKGNMVFWPHYAEIRSDLALGGTLQAERTGLQGAGAARQAGREDAAWQTWRITATLDGERLFEFLDWIRHHRMGWIWLPGADGAAWRARIAGGAGGVALRQAGTRAGAARWEASLTLETPAPVEVKANVGRSVFDPEVALGDASRVYFRKRLSFGRLTNGSRGAWGVYLGWPQGQGYFVWDAEVPSRFIQGGGRAWLSTLELRQFGRWRMRLIELGDSSGNVPGPLLTDAARRGLAFIVSWGGKAVPVVIGDVDLTEPYTVDDTTGAFGVSRFVKPFIESTDFRNGLMDVAMVWNAPGAGNTGYLADFFTTRGGAAAP